MEKEYSREPAKPCSPRKVPVTVEESIYIFYIDIYNPLCNKLSRLYFLFCFNVCAVSALLKVGSGHLNVHLESDGAYHVSVGKQQWLTNGPTFFRANGMTYSTSSGSLKRIGEPRATSGKDTLGKWNGQMLLYTADEAKVEVSVRTYDTNCGQFAVFTQVFISVTLF